MLRRGVAGGRTTCLEGQLPGEGHMLKRGVVEGRDNMLRNLEWGRDNMLRRGEPRGEDNISKKRPGRRGWGRGDNRGKA
jgi:hypothetical protein